MLEAYASTSGQGGNSGRIWSGEGQIEGIGKALVLVKASWNWSFYNGDHPSALVNNRTVDFDGCRDDGIPDPCVPGVDLSGTADLTRGVVGVSALDDGYTAGKVRRGHPDGFRTDASVTITDKFGDEIWGEIVSGSVTEVQVPGTGGGGSINEWFIGFEIVGGTGDYADASGRGHIHKIWDSGSGYSDTTTPIKVYVDDPDRFLLHEIYLRLD